jgi:hypothetical protein
MNISGIAKGISGVVKKTAGKVNKTTGKAALDGVALGVGVTKEIGKAALDVAIGASATFADTFLEYDEDKINVFGGIKANNIGKMAVLGFALGATVLDGIETYDNNKKGTPQGVVGPTPRIEPRIDNNNRYGRAESYGAGGDLVFALNNLRRG